MLFVRIIKHAKLFLKGGAQAWDIAPGSACPGEDSTGTGGLACGHFGDAAPLITGSLFKYVAQ